jgi:hypothetical protein
MTTANDILEKFDKWKQFESLLKSHNWFYERNDDYSYYAKGRDQRTRLREALRDLSMEDKKRALETWNKFAPDFFKMKGKL